MGIIRNRKARRVDLQTYLNEVVNDITKRALKRRHEHAAEFMERERFLYDYAVETGNQEMLSECLDRMLVIQEW